MSTAPICIECNEQMVERTARSTGKKFYGCIHWPRCTETAEHEDEEDEPFDWDYLKMN